MTSKNQAIRKLWEKGVLHWKLNATQKEMYDLYHDSSQKIITWLASRRLGKSHTLSVIAIETCLKEKNSIVKFLCPTAKMLKTIVIPIFRKILEDCPESVMPEYISSEGLYRFKNGSEVQLAGSDNGRAENLRGAYAHLCIVDEAGFCEDLAYTVRSVLMPTTATTRGKIVLSSTPPRSPDHEFIDFVRSAESNNTIIKKTIFDNLMFTPAEVNEIIASYPGGMQNPEFRREYLAEIIIDKESAVFPEFTEDLQSRCIVDVPRPPHYDYYVAADIGFVDYTAILFGYLDFRKAKFVIEDELIMKRMTTEDLARAIKIKETTLLTDPATGEVRKPFLRVSDTNLIVINDLQKLHGLNFLATAKDDRELAINNARIILGSEKLIIHPRCKTLISHLKGATWNKSSTKRDLGRSSEGGHYDAAMALVYLLRNVNWNKSPYPRGYDITNPNNRFVVNNRQSSASTPLSDHFSKQFSKKKV